MAQEKDKSNNNAQSENILFIFFIFMKFHLDISGILCNDMHLVKTSFIFIILLIFHCDISGKNDNDEQL